MSDDVVAKLVDDFGKIPTEFRRQLGPELKRIADPIVMKAKANASWSTRIPDAIRASARLSKKRQGVAVVVRRSKAPHARAFEGLTTRGTTFKHPVFGTSTWVDQQTRPFLFPAVREGAENVRKQVAETIDKVARQHGWR